MIPATEKNNNKTQLTFKLDNSLIPATEKQQHRNSFNILVQQQYEYL